MKFQVSKESTSRLFNRLKPFLGVIFLQSGLAGMDIFSKVALNKGMNNYVFVVYRHAIATAVIAPFAVVLDKKIRPKMTLSILAQIALLGLLEPVIDQNMYIMGLKYTTATFAAAMCNILPAITFIMACIFRLEKLKWKSVRTQAKVIGTIATVVGAMIMTLVKGPVIELIRTNGRSYHELRKSGIDVQNIIKGSLMITVGCFSWSCFMILQAVTLKTYPAELSLTAWICLFGTVEGTIVALVMERGKRSIWVINWDEKFLAAMYSGIFCSGLAYYIQGVIMKDRGPVFVTAFSPLSMVIVAIMGSLILAEQLYLGSAIGAIVIVVGLYLVVWGKSKDHTSQSPSIIEHTEPSKQMLDAGENGKGNSLLPAASTVDVSGKQVSATRKEFIV